MVGFEITGLEDVNVVQGLFLHWLADVMFSHLGSMNQHPELPKASHRITCHFVCKSRLLPGLVSRLLDLAVNRDSNEQST